MRKILSLVSAAALIALPSTALAHGSKSDISDNIKGPIKVEITVSEDLAHRANNLPKKRSDRSSRPRKTGAFANYGKYGDDAIAYLLHDLKAELIDDFVKRDISFSETPATIIKVTIEKAKPNRPTANQLKHDGKLFFKSLSTGGAEVSVEVLSNTGEKLGHAHYDYYGSFGDTAINVRNSWYDASEAFHYFSKEFSKKLVKAGASTR